MKQAIWQGEKFSPSRHAIYQAGFVQLILMVAGKCRVCHSKPLWSISGQTSLVMETNLRKGGLIHQVPYTKFREKLQELFQRYARCFANINTATYFNLFLCPFRRRDMSVMTRVPNFIL